MRSSGDVVSARTERPWFLVTIGAAIAWVTHVALSPVGVSFPPKVGGYAVLPKPSGGHTHYTVAHKSGDVSGQHAWIGYLQDPNHPDAQSKLGVVVMANSDIKGPVNLGEFGQELLTSLPMP
jgi:hypothetical protein